MQFHETGHDEPALPLKQRIRAVLENETFEFSLLCIISINAIMLGLETSRSALEAIGPVFYVVDNAILAFFVAELGARIYVHGWRFWTDPWSVFDFSVVAIAFIPATGNLTVLRALRIIRALRLISAVPSMRRVVNGLLAAIPGMGAIIALLLIIFYVGAVMATKLFGEGFPEWFGTVGASAYSLFQVMTLEAWSDGMVRPMMQVYPYAWLFFIPFILVTSFTVLNLFIGIIVDAMQSQHEAERRAKRRSDEQRLEDILDEVRALRREIERRGD